MVPALHENDRSATGYLPEPEFQAVADQFIAHPNLSIRGWETAADAQARIVACVDAIIRGDQGTADIAIVAHGAVGALLLCHLTRTAISRAMDQPGGRGGHYFAFDAVTLELIHGWRDIAEAAGSAPSQSEA